MTGRIVLASKERPGQRHTGCRAVHLYCCSCRSLRDPYADPRRVHPWRLRLQDCPLRKSQIARPRLRELEVEAHAAHSEPSRGTIDRNPRRWIRGAGRSGSAQELWPGGGRASSTEMVDLRV